jgi:hypothetical protein
MGDWRFVLTDTSGNNVADLVGAAGRKVTWNLDNAATASFTIPGTVPVASLIYETANDLVVYSPSGGKKFRGRLGASGDDVSSGGHTSNFSAVDYRGFLARRFIWPGSTTAWTAIEQTSIAWTMIADSQATTGGSLGITDHSVASGITRTVTNTVGDEILTRISEIGNFTDGFDWEIDADLSFRTYYPWRGNTNGITLAYGAEIVSFRRSVDTSTFASAVRYSGDNSLTPATAVATTFGAAGRWEIQVGDTTILNQPILNNKATFELAKDGVIAPTYDVVLRPGWWTPDLLWLGDVATLSLRSGRLDFLGNLRVQSIALDIGDNGGETVTVTFGGVPFTGAPTAPQAVSAQQFSASVAQTISDLVSRVRSLERR